MARIQCRAFLIVFFRLTVGIRTVEEAAAMSMNRITRTIPILVLLVIVLSLLSCSEQDALKWLSPSSDADVFGIVRLEVDVSMGEGVERLRFYVDAVDDAHKIGELSGDVSRVELPWFTDDVPNGVHELHAVASGFDGGTLQASVRVNVGNVSRAEAIPSDAVKMTPQTDPHPPQLHPAFADIFDPPVPMPGPINTAGAEASPFITPDGTEFYFWFTPDANAPLQNQLTDRSTGIYYSRKVDGEWTEPVRIYLTYYDEPSLDGAHTVRGDTMWFASVRAGNFREMDMWNATLLDGRWLNWSIVDERLNLEIGIGELHVSLDGNRITFDSSREGGLGEKDIWMTERVGGVWQDPLPIAAVNTENTEGWPYVTENELELWYTTGPGAPEIHRSLYVNGEWQPPETVLTLFAGEPTLDNAGNLYFAHHFWDPVEDRMIEADFYVCYRK
ncbi:MAG TPA: hypothetical protein G4O08_07955 [Anaerolineae bacterium]|nr:hypothetical protein [Anaerolineae bacterium]